MDETYRNAATSIALIIMEHTGDNMPAEELNVTIEMIARVIKVIKET